MAPPAASRRRSRRSWARNWACLDPADPVAPVLTITTGPIPQLAAGIETGAPRHRRCGLAPLSPPRCCPPDPAGARGIIPCNFRLLQRLWSCSVDAGGSRIRARPPLHTAWGRQGPRFRHPRSGPPRAVGPPPSRERITLAASITVHHGHGECPVRIRSGGARRLTATAQRARSRTSSSSRSTALQHVRNSTAGWFLFVLGLVPQAPEGAAPLSVFEVPAGGSHRPRASSAGAGLGQRGGRIDPAHRPGRARFCRGARWPEGQDRARANPARAQRPRRISVPPAARHAASSTGGGGRRAHPRGQKSLPTRVARRRIKCVEDRVREHLWPPVMRPDRPPGSGRQGGCPGLACASRIGCQQQREAERDRSRHRAPTPASLAPPLRATSRRP